MQWSPETKPPHAENEEQPLTDVTDFDLNSFFAAELGSEDAPSEVVATLRQKSLEVVETFLHTVTADTFERSSMFLTGALSLLGNLIGSCGPLCAHTLSAVAQTTNGLSGLPGLGGVSIPGLSLNGNGSFRLEEDLNNFSAATGISQTDILSGKYSAEQLLAAFFSSVGDGVAHLFGFGIINTFADLIFESFMPQTAEH